MCIYIYIFTPMNTHVCIYIYAYIFFTTCYSRVFAMGVRYMHEMDMDYSTTYVPVATGLETICTIPATSSN